MKKAVSLLFVVFITKAIFVYGQPREPRLHLNADSIDKGISAEIQLGSFDLYWKNRKRIHRHYRYPHAPNQLTFFDDKNNVWVSLVNLNPNESYVKKIIVTQRTSLPDKSDLKVTETLKTDFFRIRLGDSLADVLSKLATKKSDVERNRLETIVTYEEQLKASNSFLEIGQAFYSEAFLFKNEKLIQITLSLN